jgi:beta-phosphoglucomutase-like phosphatase (HAD superfamily)
MIVLTFTIILLRGLLTSSMRLVIFDIDGTLTQTMSADAECFVRSLADVCGFTDVDTDWSHYRHATDSGIFQDIYEARAGRSPSFFEISQFRQHFVGLLAQASSETLSRLSRERHS